MIRSDVKTWRRLRPVLASFFVVADGVWRHKRVDSELERWADKKVKAVARAQTAAAARWDKGPERPRPKRGKKRASSNATSIPTSNASSTQQALLEECPSSSSTVERPPKKGLSLSGRDASPLPDEGQAALTPENVVDFPKPETDRKAIAAELMALAGGLGRKGRRDA